MKNKKKKKHFGHEFASEFATAMASDFDPNGSYTGLPTLGIDHQPMQDADDL